MSATSTTARIPTEAEYEEAAKVLNEACGVLEDITVALKADSREEVTQFGRTPTLEDVGALWSFLESQRLSVDQITREVAQLEVALKNLDLARLDATVTTVQR